MSEREDQQVNKLDREISENDILPDKEAIIANIDAIASGKMKVNLPSKQELIEEANRLLSQIAPLLE